MAFSDSTDRKSGNAEYPTEYVAIQTSCSSSFPYITRDSLTYAAAEAPAEVLSTYFLELQKYTEEQEYMILKRYLWNNSILTQTDLIKTELGKPCSSQKHGIKGRKAEEQT